MVSLVVGILTLTLVGLVSFILGDWSLVYKFSGVIGLVTFIISALLSGALSGAFISGDRMRANWTYEDRNDRDDLSEGWASKLFLFGVPNLVGAIIYLVFIF